MLWFVNLKTGAKLIVSFGILILILGFVIAVALKSLNKIATLSEEIYEKQLHLVDNITQMDDDNNAIYIELLNLVLTSDKPDIKNSIKRISDINEAQEHAKKDILNIIQNDADISNDFESFLILRAETKHLQEEQILPLISSGNIEQAKNIIMNDFKNKENKMSKSIEKMTEKAKQKSKLSVQHANSEVKKIEMYFLAVGCFALFVSIILIWILNRLIASPINELSSIAKKIANRDLMIPNITFANRTDEVGMLGNSFIIMVENLKEMTQELIEAINHLSSSSTEIVTASNQLAASAAETSTAINETTSTIEEVKQTSQVASKKAKVVSEASSKTSEMSDMGKKAAEEINAVISKIQNQMTLVGETMMRLSEQTQTVGTIISTVEDLSQQTNLLAVNASIEASKAGEQGKGFSVVAQEVKSLATQSKQATTQVRNILSDIQKATSAAVMATEMGSKAVETGVSKTDEAEEAILMLIKTISDNAHAATQIAEVNHQQLIGMEQAKIAMENIRQASDQNVESAKLLKDSMLSIQELSMSLKKMVDQFKFKK